MPACQTTSGINLIIDIMTSASIDTVRIQHVAAPVGLLIEEWERLRTGHEQFDVIVERAKLAQKV